MASTDRPFAVVTGASSGIGLELARQFARHGFDVLVTAEDAGIADAAGSLGVASAEVTAVQADLSTPAGVEQLWSRVSGTGRPVDAVALNAGIGVSGRFVETDLGDDLRLIGLNVTGTVHLAKYVLRQMAARGEGRALFTASVAATMPGPFYATYAASKAFLLSFAEAVRYELKDSGVTVTALLPGPTDTEFFETAGMQDTRVGASDAVKDDPADVAKDGFEALMAGKDSVVAGSLANKAQVASGRLFSEPIKAAMHAKMTEPGKASD